MAVRNPLKRREFRKPRLPRGLFALIPVERENLADAEEDEVIGPYDSGNTITEEDGSVTFISEGLPYLLSVVDQEGDVITIEGGQKLRAVRWA